MIYSSSQKFITNALEAGTVLAYPCGRDVMGVLLGF